MPILRPSPTLASLQKYVAEMEKERGFDGQEPIDKCLHLGEEVGELFKAVRSLNARQSVDPSSDRHAIGEEIADVLILLTAIANRYHIDMEAAFRAKEEKNTHRKWVRAL